MKAVVRLANNGIKGDGKKAAAPYAERSAGQSAEHDTKVGHEEDN